MKKCRWKVHVNFNSNGIKKCLARTFAVRSRTHIAGPFMGLTSSYSESHFVFEFYRLREYMQSPFEVVFISFHTVFCAPLRSLEQLFTHTHGKLFSPPQLICGRLCRKPKSCLKFKLALAVPFGRFNLLESLLPIPARNKILKNLIKTSLHDLVGCLFKQQRGCKRSSDFCKPNVRITGTLARLVCCRHSHVELHLNKFSPLYNIEFAYFTRHFEQ